MRAIHVNWTKPFFERHRLRGHGFESTRSISSDCYDQTDHQVLYTILSAVHWNLHNGPIKLYTDSIGLEFYQQFGILDMYDEVDINFLNAYSKSNIDSAYFWTSGKIKCLAHQRSPFAFLDQDMIIRSKLPDYIYKGDICVAHWEIPRGYYYFEKEDWETEISHVPFPDNYNTSDWSPNTSFLLFSNMKLLSDYHDAHKKLVNTNGAEVPEWFWLLTDQGILGHTIRENGYTAQTISDRVFLANSNYGDGSQRGQGKSEAWYYPMGCTDKKDKDINWEHVWFNKIHVGYDKELMKRECQRYFNEIVSIGYANMLTHSRFKKYWDEYQG
jgi:hypothetical protein